MSALLPRPPESEGVGTADPSHPRTRVVVAAVLVACVLVAESGPPRVLVAAVLAVACFRRRLMPGRTLLVGMLASLAPFAVVLPLMYDAAEGVRVAGTVLFRSLSLLVIARLLFASGPLHAVVLAWKLPGFAGKMQMLVLLTLHSVAAVFEQSRVVQNAARTRGFRPRTDRRTRTAFGQILRRLLLRAEAQGERAATAMQSRGWAGRWPTLRVYAFGAGDRRLLFAAFVVLLSVVVLECSAAEESP